MTRILSGASEQRAEGILKALNHWENTENENAS